MNNENLKRRGRKAGEDYTKPKSYIIVNDKLRVKIDTDCLVLEQSIGEDAWGNNKYFTSWSNILDWLIKKFTIDKLSGKELWTFVEAKKEIVEATKEVKNVLIGEIDNVFQYASEEVKDSINKFNR